MKNLAVRRFTARLVFGCAAVLLWMPPGTILRAATTGAISGTLVDPSGSVIPGAAVTATNTAQGIQNKTLTDSKGFYSFPSLRVGIYDIKGELEGFKPRNRKGVVVDLDSALAIQYRGQHRHALFGENVRCVLEIPSPLQDRNLRS